MDKFERIINNIVENKIILISVIVLILLVFIFLCSYFEKGKRKGRAAEVEIPVLAAVMAGSEAEEDRIWQGLSGDDGLRPWSGGAE